jgi:mRNA interferase HigB
VHQDPEWVLALVEQGTKVIIGYSMPSTSPLTVVACGQGRCVDAGVAGEAIQKGKSLSANGVESGVETSSLTKSPRVPNLGTGGKGGERAHEAMHVITRKRLVQFGQSYPDVVTPLDAWFRLMKAGRFANSAQLKATFGSVDLLAKGLAVFDIGGNKCRLVTHVRYATVTNIGRVWVLEVLTHAQYDAWSKRRQQGKQG